MNQSAVENSDVKVAVRQVCAQAQVGQKWLAQANTASRNELLESIAQRLLLEAERIEAANRIDLERERAAGMSEGLLDRLRLDYSRIEDLAAAVRTLVDLPDPVGRVIDGQQLPNGLRVRRQRVPLGVVGMIYEARPNVTVDAACLALKAGNAVILRGGSAAAESNAALVEVMRTALAERGCPPQVVASVDAWGREGARQLMRARGYIDVLVPRGGGGLISAVVEESTVPVIETGVGNCHIYVDASADLTQALEIVMNAKTQRVGVCNAVETVLVDESIAPDFLPVLESALGAAGVRIHPSAQAAKELQNHWPLAGEDDWAGEYLSMDLALATTAGVEGAIEHIERYSSGHTEAVLATDTRVINDFVRRVDAAAVAVNASTRFTDGGQLGLGAELGISTQKLHARGPMGLEQLTTWKWIIEGDGHVRA
ncbi:MAG: glutamate-5-semialdehyde dehydrogenase [Actinomycetaceae bacterium]|nr:glutamate-5-semialdehyde dehydrogenase [Actinomycetaceae bacterium]